MRKIPFALRFYALCALSFVLAHLWLGVSLPARATYVSAGTAALYDLIPDIFYLICGLVYVVFLGKILRNRIRRLPYLLYLVASGVYVLIVLQSGFRVWQAVPDANSNVLIISLVIPLAIAFLPPFALYQLERFREHPFYRQLLEGAGGSSRWAGLRTFARHPAQLKQALLSFHRIKNKGVTSGNIFIGRTLWRQDPFPRPVGFGRDNKSHNVTIAAARSGKSVDVLNHIISTYLGDLIICDVKGEHTKNTSCRRSSVDSAQKRGLEHPNVYKNLPNGEVSILDPCGITGIESAYCNPLDEVDIDDPNCREAMAAIADGCILPESEKNKYFEEMSKLVFQGGMAYDLSQFRDPKKRTLPYVADLLYGIDEHGFADPQKFDELLIDMLMCNAAGGVAQQAASDLRKMGERERGAVLSTLSRNLYWITDPAMRRQLSRSDFKFSEVGTKMTSDEFGRPRRVIQTVYIVLPDTRLSDLKRWMRTLLALGTVAMRKRKTHPDLATLWLLDEFPLLGGIKTISEGFGLLAGYKQRFHIFCQSLGQLKASYPNYWNAMIANSNAQFFGQPLTDLETLEFISKALGKHNIRHTPRDLLTPAEIAGLIGQGTNKQIVFPANEGMPMLLERLAFKPLRIAGKRHAGLSLDGLRGHFPDW